MALLSLLSQVLGPKSFQHPLSHPQPPYLYLSSYEKLLGVISHLKNVFAPELLSCLHALSKLLTWHNSLMK